MIKRPTLALLAYACLGIAPLAALAADPPTPPAGGPPPGGPGHMEGQMFRDADKNKDGVISRDEP